jgi:hypothetical protein
LLIGAGILLTTSVAVISVFFASWFVSPELAKKDPLVAENSVRDVGLKLAAGLGAVFAAILTWGRLELSRQEHQREVSGQLTERFTRAIDQLGSEKLDVRLGGIYALERIARESQEDHGPIMEIFAAYLGEHAPWPPTKQDDDDAPLATRAADVQAVITVLGRRVRERKGPDDWRWLSLRRLDLRNADLIGAHLERAILTGVHLEGAELIGAHLEGAELIGAHLEGAALKGAHLEAYLREAHLEGAGLKETHLEAAVLKDAHLEGADLREAHLKGAHLEGAFLEYAHLEGADLRNVFGLTQDQINSAFTDKATSLPFGLKESARKPLRDFDS